MLVSQTPPGSSLVIDVSGIGPQTKRFDFAGAKAAGAVAALIIATEGEDYTDPMWDWHHPRAAAAGLMLSGIHVFRPEHEAPEVQAKHYDTVARPWSMLCPIVDLEPTKKDHGIPMDVVAQRALEFVLATRVLWRKAHGLAYLSVDYLTRLCATREGKNAVRAIASMWDLWIAKYGPEPAGSDLAPWPAYTGWQYGQIVVSGETVDASRFAGDEKAIAKLGDAAS